MHNLLVKGVIDIDAIILDETTSGKKFSRFAYNNAETFTDKLPCVSLRILSELDKMVTFCFVIPMDRFLLFPRYLLQEAFTWNST